MQHVFHSFQSIDLVSLPLDKNIGYIMNMVIDISHDYKFLIVEHNLNSLTSVYYIQKHAIYSAELEKIS